MYVHQCPWSHCWLQWVMYVMYDVVICPHELICTCGLGIAFEGHISFGMFMAEAYYLSCEAHGAVSNTIALVMLRWLFRGIIDLLAPLLVPVLASVSCAIDDAIGVMWIWCQWHYMNKNKLCSTLFWLSWSKECSADFDDTISNTSGITWSSHVASHFSSLRLRNAMVPLMMLFGSFNADTNANGMMWHQ